jgi:nitrile hydratase accessory protein
MLPQSFVLSDMPKDADGPVFRAPWEAMAFAIVVKLSEQGHFTWAEWVQIFSAEIKRAESHPSFDVELDNGNEYYHIWLAALEKMIVAKDLVQSHEVNMRRQHLIDNPVPHDHIARREPIRVT